MDRRYLKVALFVLLIAATAFVLEVLSPLTPTPNADTTAKLLFAVLIIVMCVGFSEIPPAKTMDCSRISRKIPQKHSPRAFLVWLRVLLD